MKLRMRLTLAALLLLAVCVPVSLRHASWRGISDSPSLTGPQPLPREIAAIESLVSRTTRPLESLDASGQAEHAAAWDLEFVLESTRPAVGVAISPLAHLRSTAYSDAEGRVRLDALPASSRPAGSVSHWIARGSGFAPRILRLDATAASRSPRRVQLQPGSLLSVQLEGPSQLGVEVRVSVDLVELAHSAGAEESAVQADSRGQDTMTRRVVGRVDGHEPWNWIAHTDAAGRVCFADLPRGVDLILDAQAEGTVHAELAQVHFGLGEAQREIRLSLPAARGVPGRIQTASGEPIVQRRVWAVKSRTESAFAYLSNSQASAHAALTDAQGNFFFEQLPEGSWMIGLAPRQHSSDSDQELPAYATRVEVNEAMRPVEIVIDLGSRLRGFVVDSSGASCSDAFVTASPIGGDGMLSVSTLEDGSFDIGPVQRGAFELRAVRESCACASEPSVIDADAAPVLLQVADPTRLLIEAWSVPDGLARRPSQLLFVREDGEVLQVRPARAGGSTAEIAGIPPGRYDVVAYVGEAWVGVARGFVLSASAPQSRLRIELASAAELRVNNPSPRRAAAVLVRDDTGSAVGFASLFPGGVASLRVPSGRLHVVSNSAQRSWLEITAWSTLDSGASVTLPDEED